MDRLSAPVRSNGRPPARLRRRVLAFDFDGTLAQDGKVPGVLLDRLARIRDEGNVLFLVTGRRFESHPLEGLRDLMTGIVWENGAVLYHTATGEVYLPFGRVNEHLVTDLERAGVPLEHGTAIVATWSEHEDAVWHAIRARGTDAVVAHNKGALMIVPPGAPKGSGMARLLELCGYSARNLVAFGDAENDVSLLEMADTAVAVADAVPAIRMAADIVATQPGPSGVIEVLERDWCNEPLAPSDKDRPLILIGEDATGTGIYVPCARLATSMMGIFGDSGSGKSWMAGLLAEGMIVEGYQVLVIDAEGDYRGLRMLPQVAALSGDKASLPSPAAVAALVEAASVSFVVDLSGYPYDERPEYVLELFHALAPLRDRKFRPHWILLEEAQEFFHPADRKLTALLEPMLREGGLGLVTYRPDRLAPAVLAAADWMIVARLTARESYEALQPRFGELAARALKTTPRGHAWLCDDGVVELCMASRRIAHVRHLYKYRYVALPKYKRFFFRDEQRYLGIEAASLFELKEILPTLPITSVLYHARRGDFAAWARGALGDESLALHLAKLCHRDLEPEALREAIVERVRGHYAQLYDTARAAG